MKLSEEGIKHIQGEEGLRTQAYQDEGQIWTIGYGHTGTEAYRGASITNEQADEFFRKDVSKFEDAVRKAVTTDITQKQFDALVSFTYNVGEGHLKQSSLLAKVNKGDFKGAAAEFDKWVRVGKDHVSKGLVARRDREKRIFMGEDAYKSNRLADTGTGSSQKLGKSDTLSEDQLANIDNQTLASMQMLGQKLGAAPDALNEEEYLNRLRKEGSGVS